MKQLTIALSLFAILSVSCSTQSSGSHYEIPVAPEITFEDDDLHYGYDEQDCSVPYTLRNASDQTFFETSCSSDWIHGIVMEDSCLKFRIDDGFGYGTRVGNIEVIINDPKTGLRSERAKVRVEQDVAETAITTSSNRFSLRSVDYGGLEVEYSIQNPRKGAKLNIRTNKDWIQLSADSGKSLVFSVSANTTGASRSGDILMDYGVYCTTCITIDQDK